MRGASVASVTPRQLRRDDVVMRDLPMHGAWFERGRGRFKTWIMGC
jgi:hypothetical protein